MIELNIKSNGAITECRVSGYIHDNEANKHYIFKNKPIWECDKDTLIEVMDALRTIEVEYKRRNNIMNKQIWHDAKKEEPKEGTDIILVTSNLEVLQYDNYSKDRIIPDWNTFVKEENIEYWCLERDALPKNLWKQVKRTWKN